MNKFSTNVVRVLVACAVASLAVQTNGQDDSLVKTLAAVQPRIVKIYGSGGFRGLEPYQSAFLISSEGHILTVWSYVLDSDHIVATLTDGQRFEARLVGYDPRTEIAVLKIGGSDLPAFNIEDRNDTPPGKRILAFSNLFRVATGNELASVLHGVIAARVARPTRRGAIDSSFDGEILILDAMTNNPGAAGGAVTDLNGRLLGIIGKEQKDSLTGTWLNFAIPIDQVRDSVLDILSGKMIIEIDEPGSKAPGEPVSFDLLGIQMVPEIVRRTPPFIDVIVPKSPAAEVGLMPDDLIVEVNGKMTPTLRSVQEQFEKTDRDRTVVLTIQRKNRFKEVELRLNR